ncbi:MAG: Na/Pi cotransporter family protein, partial [Clostridia bacterium]|nr:Na/Pi cotransporter family protein [Clostridia bacterium]
SDNAFLGVGIGAGVTAVAQSSAAIDIVVVEMVEKGLLSLYGACAVIMGANVGTTVTAQIISLSGTTFFNVTAIASFIGFIGLAVKFVKKGSGKPIGDMMIGFGLLFIGLDIMSERIGCFKGFTWFRNIFLIDNNFILFLNGVAITAIMQSSSAMTGIMAILANGGLMPFKNATFLILGANVGSCFAVIISSLRKSAAARRAAYFNLLFNLFGSALFFIPLSLWGDQISIFISSGRNVGRAIADFHTVFNMAVTLVSLPLLKAFTGFLNYLIKDQRPTKRKYVKEMS